MAFSPTRWSLWYTLALNLFKEIGKDSSDFKQPDDLYKKIKKSLKKEVSSSVCNFYKNKMIDKISRLTDSSKLFLYRKLKTEIKLEDYLIQQKVFKFRQNLTKLRTSDHCLNIETGRYKKIPREQRLCSSCNEEEDEFHFLLICRKNKDLRYGMFNKINGSHLTSFSSLSSVENVKFLLTPTPELLSVVCNFITKSLELR